MTENEKTTKAFIKALLSDVSTETSRKETQDTLEYVFPVLIPGIIQLLKAVEENKARLRAGETDVMPIKPLDYLARYLYRHNPKHTSLVSRLYCYRVFIWIL
jgi:hypothetical protein